MVSISPRLRDSLEYEEADATDFRLSFGFQSSLNLQASGYEDHEHLRDFRPSNSSTPERPLSRRKKHRGTNGNALESLPLYRFQPCPDEFTFRLVKLLPGTGREPVHGQMIFQHCKLPTDDFVCLSYCWETTTQDAVVYIDDARLPITQNLLSALRNVRKPGSGVLIWVDQVCINQDDPLERGHQVSIMKSIFCHAKTVIVWLGEEDDRSSKLCEYAKKMRRDEGSRQQNKILNPRQLQEAMQHLLKRPWFQRVWVISEVALARFTTVAIGKSVISWDNLVCLIRDVPPPLAVGFVKQTALLGNTRQRIAIITQMAASQREGSAHTDITQLLILAKSSDATDDRDRIYAFYGLTLITTVPNYTRSLETLYIEVAEEYINNIQFVTYYSDWHKLSEEQRTFQLLSILYSAGTLHQTLTLPSWVPDWTCKWYLAPIWAKTTSNIVTGTGKDEWSAGIRGDFRAGGNSIGTFDVLQGAYGDRHLCVTALIFDTISFLSETTPASTPIGHSEVDVLDMDTGDSHLLRYGRTFFSTAANLVGMGTPGVQPGDVLAIVLGGDVPLILRPCGDYDDDRRAFRLLCECYVQSKAIMQGELVDSQHTQKEDVVLV